MDQGLIPRRYAKALYKAADKTQREKLYRLTGNMADSFNAAPALQTTVANPFVSVADKTSLLTTAAGADAANDKLFGDFLKLLTVNNRLADARDIAIAYRDLYRRENNISRVTVTSAEALDADVENRLKKLISSHLGNGSMEFEKRVDPSLIGGFTIDVDNERLDASVANELRQLRQKLILH